jgi:tRNA threonylcarbamoyladenosine biosynthesis protein TsaB
MAMLALEASVSIGSVAVVDGGRVLAEREVAMRGAHEERLMPAVADALAEAAIAPRELERVICGAGPGSFTSLRIAASIAKGLAVAADIALHALPSPLLMVAGHMPLVAGRYLTVLDAMRDECFVALWRVATGRIDLAEALPLTPRDDVSRLAMKLNARTIGPRMDIDARPHARGAALAGLAFDLPTAVSLDGWEPTYGRLAEAQVKWEKAHGRPLL